MIYNSILLFVAVVILKIMSIWKPVWSKYW